MSDTPNERIEASLVRLESDTSTLNNIVHGPEGETVPTESGEVPTVHELFRQIGEHVGSVTTAAAVSAEQARVSAVSAAESANVAANQVNVATAAAESAERSAQAAEQSVAAATGQVTAAAESAQQARASASTAAQVANQAQQAAQNASQKADTAGQAAAAAGAKADRILAGGDADKGAGAVPYGDQLEYAAGSVGEAVQLVKKSQADFGGSGGAARVGYKMSDAGRARTVEQKFQETVSALDFDDGTGSADATANIRKALAAGQRIDFGDSSKVYRIAGTLLLTAGQYLFGNGARIIQTLDQTPLFDCTGVTGITIEGLQLEGKQEATYTNSPSSRAIGISARNAKRLVIRNNRFIKFWYSPLYVNSGGDSIEFSGNYVQGPGQTVLSDINYRNTTGATVIGSNIRIENNEVTATAQGFIVGEGSSNVVIDGNIIHDLVNEHGIYCDTGLRNLTISNNTVVNTGAHGTGMKVQCYDSPGIIPEGISISGNTIVGTGGDGILIINTSTGTPVIHSIGVSITGNSVCRAGQHGINVRSADGCVVAGNTIRESAYNGIYLDSVRGLTLTANSITGSGSSAIYSLRVSAATISMNSLVDCGGGSAFPDNVVIHVVSGSHTAFTGNFISRISKTFEYGLFIETGDQTTISVSNNSIFGSNAAAFRFKSSVERLAYFGGNSTDKGAVYLSESIQRGEISETYFGTAAPTAGTWQQGARVHNLYPAPGGYSGWVCVSGGSPGGWRGFGLVQA